MSALPAAPGLDRPKQFRLRARPLWRLCWALCLAAAAACSPQPAVPPAPDPAPSKDLTASSPLTPSPLALPTRRPPALTPATSTPAATIGRLPDVTPAATPVPPPATQVPPAPTPCANDARFLRDVTIPDGMQLLPGQLIVKKWSVKNTGTCDWGANYRLALISGDPLGAPSAVALYPARAGATGTWEIPMVAPQNPGAYLGKWQARDPAGNLFGAVVFIKIEVIPLPTVSSP